MSDSDLANDPNLEDFLLELLRQLAESDLNRQMLLRFAGPQPEVQRRFSFALDELVRRGWANLSEIDYLSITEEGKRRKEAA